MYTIPPLNWSINASPLAAFLASSQLVKAVTLDLLCSRRLQNHAHHGFLCIHCYVMNIYIEFKVILLNMNMEVVVPDTLTPLQLSTFWSSSIFAEEKRTLLHADVTTHTHKRCNIKHCPGKCSILISKMKTVKNLSRCFCCTYYCLVTTSYCPVYPVLRLLMKHTCQDLPYWSIKHLLSWVPPLPVVCVSVYTHTCSLSLSLCPIFSLEHHTINRNMLCRTELQFEHQENPLPTAKSMPDTLCNENSLSKTVLRGGVKWLEE